MAISRNLRSDVEGALRHHEVDLRFVLGRAVSGGADGRCIAIATTKLEEFMLWARKAIEDAAPEENIAGNS